MNNSSSYQLKQTLLDQYLKVEFISAIFLTVLSPLTVSANTLLLATVWRNPLGCFRTPTIYFTIGLALADLLCGLTVEPLFALFYYSKYFQLQDPNTRALIKTLYKVGGGISTVTVSTSYLLVLGLSACQLIAVRFPHRYKQIVTKRRVFSYVLCSWLYFFLFRAIQLTGIDLKTLLKVDVFLHSTLISVVLLAVHILMYQSLKKQALKRRAAATRERSGLELSVEMSPNFQHLKWKSPRRNRKSGTAELRRKHYFEKQITVLAAHLASILLVSACCHITVLNILLYKKVESFQEEVYINIAVRASDLMLFLKVAVDAFVYAWRLPTYRKAFILTICPKFEEPQLMI